MSFIDSVKNIGLFAIIDEYGGKGSPAEINDFYIVLRVTDNRGQSIQITSGDVDEAVRNNQFMLSDYMGVNKIPLGMNNDNRFDFNINDVKYNSIYNYNYFSVGTSMFHGSCSVCAIIRKEQDGEIIASTCYQSRFQSTLYLSKK
ncbi:hypothetical protein [Serratia marcescens]|uniref:hypothetical protein n=1 Tax=Serratia marcescens TaxID=615 RepID=UPI0007C94D0D|nr:hypothetical protein [Serratia marcescens]OAH32777.1 hypothetical protein AYJ10_18750 [Serratia marcescens]